MITNRPANIPVDKLTDGELRRILRYERGTSRQHQAAFELANRQRERRRPMKRIGES